MAKPTKKSAQSTPAPGAEDATAQPLSYEAAYARLETVLGQLENGDLALEASLALYEEGVRLAAYCATQLDEAELRVRQWLPGDETSTFDDWSDESGE